MVAKPSAAEHGMATAPPGPIQAAPASASTIPPGFEDNFGWLLAQCFRAHVFAMDRAIADFPHGHRGFQALSGAANCSAHNQAGLAKQLGVDRTVMVYLVDDLEKAGLVERVPDPNDRRSRLIRATTAGLARLATAQAAISAAEAELLGVLDNEQQKSLRAMLRNLAAHHFGAMDTAAACGMVERVRETSA